MTSFLDHLTETAQPEKRWYVIHTYSGYEKKVKTNLEHRIETMGMEDKIYQVLVPEELDGVLIPPLVLQPLVENAVLHGVAPRKEGGGVRVTATRSGSRLVLSVTDDGDGPGSSPHRGSGTSMADLERRLEMVYGEDARLASATDEEGFRVDLTVPLGQPT